MRARGRGVIGASGDVWMWGNVDVAHARGGGASGASGASGAREGEIR